MVVVSNFTLLPDPEFTYNPNQAAPAPTITDTELASKILRNEKVIENLIERHPLKKILSADEVSKMAEFLISDNSSSISGQIFNMDAGIVSFKS